MAYVFTEQAWSTRRLVGLLAAIAVNVGLVAMLANGLNFRLPLLQPPQMEVFEVETAPVEEIEEVAPPPPEVQTAPPEPLDMPLPEIELPPEPQQQETITATTEPPPVQAPAAPSTDRKLQPDPNYKLTPPVYPAQSRRLNEQGTVLLMIYVLADGRVGDVKVAKSSGHPRLDQAAIEAAKKNWRFQAATQGGRPVAAWGQYAVSFQLTGNADV